MHVFHFAIAKAYTRCSAVWLQ